MKNLPLWVLPASLPSIYDTHSGTLLEQTAKIYGAMNDLITEMNKFQEETGCDIEEFKCTITNALCDFMKLIELKIDEQNLKIDEIKVDIKVIYDELNESLNIVS